LSQECSFSVTPLDFYASQLSPTIILRGTRSQRHIDATLQAFYLPPMERVEIAGKTFFIFEAQADHALQLREIQDFGLADDQQGARAHFFWAIGATSPFPFLRDAQRKDLQIFHVVYATLALDGGARGGVPFDPDDCPIRTIDCRCRRTARREIYPENSRSQTGTLAWDGACGEIRDMCGLKVGRGDGM
jgi:hypothetical protein